MQAGRAPTRAERRRVAVVLLRRRPDGHRGRGGDGGGVLHLAVSVVDEGLDAEVVGGGDGLVVAVLVEHLQWVVVEVGVVEMLVGLVVGLVWRLVVVQEEGIIVIQVHRFHGITLVLENDFLWFIIISFSLLIFSNCYLDSVWHSSDELFSQR